MASQEPETAIPLILSQLKGEWRVKCSYFGELNMSDPVNIDRKYLIVTKYFTFLSVLSGFKGCVVWYMWSPASLPECRFVNKFHLSG
jgi:hypothetical protein